MRSSTACIPATRSGPISTWRRSMRLSPTLSRCSSTSPCLSRSLGRSGERKARRPRSVAVSDNWRSSSGRRWACMERCANLLAKTGAGVPKLRRHGHRAAYARRDSGLGRVRRVPHDLSVAERRPDPARDQWVRHPSRRRNLGRSREPARERGVENGGACSQHVHPRARLLSSRQSRIRRLSARDHHRGSRSRARRQPRLSCRLHRCLPRTRNRAL